MPIFTVRVVSGEGVIRNQDIEASSLDQARFHAERLGQVLTIKKKFNVDLALGMTTPERHNFMLRLAAMMAANMSVVEALKVISGTFGGRIQKAAKGLLGRLESGMEFDEAVSVDYKNFKPATSALIKAGIQAGDTQTALESAVEFEQLMSQVQKGAYKHFMWAFVAFSVAFAITYYTIYYFAPMILENPMIKNNKAIDVTMASIFSHVLLWVIGIKLAIFTAFLLLGTVVRAAVPNTADAIILRIPQYKDLVLSRQNYVTLYKLGLMVGSGMTTEDTLRFTEFEAPKGALKTDLKRARRFLEEGKPWPNALDSLHPTDRAALASATDNRDQAKTLNALAKQYRDLYIGKVNSFGPAIEFTSALYLVAATVSLICLTVIPTMQLTASIN
jgi:general secretion pathway protein F